MTHPPISTQVIAPDSPTSPKTVNQGPSSPNQPKSAISNGTIHSISSPQGMTPSSFAPSVRHPLSRPLSPDLPSRDALYLFCNFSSYMRSPQEGAEGIKTGEDFRDTTRLLDYARALSGHAHSNIHVCHLKYRFQGQTQTFRSPYATGDYQLPLNYRDSTGRLRNPVPQPFSTLHDEVIKIDYKENGVFHPLPAQAIFDHIAKKCQPPPRIIVISYVCSKVTENHLAAFSTWARTSSPPCYVFSPLETRIREKRPLRLALHHAIPMSMYAWPADYTLNTSPSSGSITPALPIRGRRTSAPTITTGAHIINQALSRGHQDPILIQSDSHPERQYPSDPVASLTVVGADEVIPVDQSFESKGSISSQSTVDRIPLWALAPGVGVLHGSTSASIGVKLSDFSAIALTEDTASKRTSSTGKGVITREEAGIKMTSIDMRSLVDQPIPPVEAPNRPNTPSKALAQMAKSIRPGRDRVAQYKETHLSPPDAAKPAVHLSPLSRTTSWPGSVNKVPGWKKGRKEQMADTLEALATCEDPVDEVALGLIDLTTSDHDGRGDGQDGLFGVL